MIVMAFGTFPGVQDPTKKRGFLIGHLQERFGNELKIVHGATDGHFGPFGNDRRIIYTFTFEHFDGALSALGRLNFGQIEELNPPS
jgi:hypothetical protein